MKKWMLPLVLLCLGGAVFCRASAAAAEGTATTEPENLVGVVGEDGRMDYGSPTVEQQLAAPHVFAVGYFSRDREYGRTPEKPIMVGHGENIVDGPMNEQRFLNALAGPNGEAVRYERRGSSHDFKTENCFLPGMDLGILDVYLVTYEGLAEPITLLLNMYDSDTLKIPVGFRMKYAPGVPPPSEDELY